MNAKEAWLFIADKFQEYAEGEKVDSYTCCGLCFAVSVLSDDGQITTQVTRQMGRDIESVLVGDESYLASYGRASAGLRAKVARKLASRHEC